MHRRLRLLALAASIVLATGAVAAPGYGVPGHAVDQGADVAPPASMKPGAFPKPHYGYGPVLVGMTAAALKRTGQVRDGANWTKAIATAKKDLCFSLRLKAPGASVDIQPDKASGTVKVSAVFFGRSMKTSKGIGLGSTLGQVEKAYPKVDWVEQMKEPGEPSMLLGSRVLYDVGIEQTNRVGELLMYWSGQTCFS